MLIRVPTTLIFGVFHEPCNAEARVCISLTPSNKQARQGIQVAPGARGWC